MFAVEVLANSAKWFLENCLQNWLSLGKICFYGKQRYWENLKERESKREGRVNRLKGNFKQVAFISLCPNCSIISYPKALVNSSKFLFSKSSSVLIQLCCYLGSDWLFLSLQASHFLGADARWGVLSFPYRFQLIHLGALSIFGSHGFASSQLRKGMVGTFLWSH